MKIGRIVLGNELVDVIKEPPMTNVPLVPAGSTSIVSALRKAARYCVALAAEAAPDVSGDDDGLEFAEGFAAGCTACAEIILGMIEKVTE